VREIDVVARSRRDGPRTPTLPPARPEAGGALAPPATTALFDYGSSFNQLQMIRVVDLHDMGLDGSDVFIGHFDNGYRLLTHEVFAALRVHAAWDFVANEADPAPDPCPPGQECTSHGVETLSILAGFKQGKLIGPAFGATYLLARTESDAVESPAEEDLWVAAMEWADSIGVDVVSSSVGYREFDSPHRSYTWEDMDGDTAVITRAADMAAARGIVVVNGIGNDGIMFAPNTIYAPADGDSVVAVGAVDRNGVRTLISSYGPTADGRTKPDVLAQGIGTIMAQAGNPMAYGGGFGTSAATPLVAGAAALLRQAFPGAAAMQIVDALRLTARRAADPDPYEGWGIIDALAAYRYLRDLEPPTSPFGGRMARIVPNPYPLAPPLAIRVDLPAPAGVSLHLFDVRGRLVRRLFEAPLQAAQHTIAWDGQDDQGRRLAAGTYFVRLRAAPLADPADIRTETRKLTLLHR
jgi:subtilisin family serine protease